MGQILVRGGIAERTYRALEAWLGWLPGGLVHANIGTATLFSATSGSSVATAATVANRGDAAGPAASATILGCSPGRSPPGERWGS